ncbi:MAG: hypothetical protein ACKVOP_14435 [Sphingomonadaceae bacterium]
MINRGKTIAGATAALSLLLTPVTAFAKANELRDLVGARASAAEGDLESRGWALISSHKGAASSYTYWWNARGKSCVRATTRDGRYDSITDMSNSDCGQRGGSDGAAIAVAGAAALIGVLALTHKSHDRNDQQYQNANDYAEFERGHRDGLYNHAFSNYNNSSVYVNGYQSGVNERARQSSYRPEYRNHTGNGWSFGGNTSGEAVGFSDLVGARAAGAQSDLGNRGFRQVDTVQSGDNSVITIWWNSRSRQCLQFITANGRADSISDIGSHPRCR